MKTICSFWIWCSNTFQVQTAANTDTDWKSREMLKENSRWKMWWVMRLPGNRSVTWLGIKSSPHCREAEPFWNKHSEAFPLCWKTVQQFKSHVFQHESSKNYGILLSTVHNIINLAVKQHCIKNRQDSIVDATVWTHQHFQKPQSVNAAHHCTTSDSWN